MAIQARAPRIGITPASLVESAWLALVPPRLEHVKSVGAVSRCSWFSRPLSLVVGLCIVYFLIATENRARQKDSAALIAIIVSQVVTAIQVLGILDLLSVQWPEPFASILAMSSLLHFNLDVLSPNCVMSTPALMSYCMSLFAFVLLLTVLILIHFVSVIVFFRARFFSEGRTSLKPSTL